MDMGGGDLMNMSSGEILWDMDGDKLGSDGLYLNMGDGDLLNPGGGLTINMD